MPWNQNIDIPKWRCYEKLKKLFDWDFRNRLEPVSEAVLSGNGYLI